jgi:hypothetical protein
MQQSVVTLDFTTVIGPQLQPDVTPVPTWHQFHHLFLQWAKLYRSTIMEDSRGNRERIWSPA